MSANTIIPVFVVAMAIVAFAFTTFTFLQSQKRAEPEQHEKKLVSLEARMKSIEAEWADVYDKLNRLAGRLTKERGLLETKSKDATVSDDGASGSRGLPSRASILIGREHAR